MLKRLLVPLAVLALSATAVAAPAQTPVQRLDALLGATNTFTAHFTETVTNANAVTVKQSSGAVAIAKPGRFRWDYDRPYRQIIVADGTRLWIYDPDLQQVTVRPESQAFTAGPAALLAGVGSVEASFTVSAAGTSDGYEWLQLIPKSSNASYRVIRIGLVAGSGIGALQLQSRLGQTSTIVFTDAKSNAKIAASRFRFTPPAGADVVHETPSAAGAAGS